MAGCIRTNGLNDFLVARFKQDGDLDTFFGTGGSTIVTFGTFADIGLGVAIQPDGRIVAAGFGNNGTNNYFAVARLDANGLIDTTFDGDGRQQTMIGTTSASANAVAVQADGKIVAAGRTVIAGTADFAVARYGYGMNTLGNDGFFALNSVTAIRFDNAFRSGTTNSMSISPEVLPPLPTGWSFSGPPQIVQTDALFSGNVSIRFTAASDLDMSSFNAIRIFQHENGAWTDKTMASPARDFATKTVYASVSSLGVITAVSPGTLAPTATVSGRVTTPSGQNLRNVVVSMIDTDNLRRTATTSTFGTYTFADVATSRTYTLTSTSKRYRFTAQVLMVDGNVGNIDFIGLE